MKVIIADDEPKICKLIMKLVDWEAMDMEVSAVVHDGIEALSSIALFKPDIVITDIRMPGYDGLELIRKSQEISPDTEFIIISGYRQFEYAKSAISYGVKNYLLKPIQTTELTETLSKLRIAYIQKHSQITNAERYKIIEENNRMQKRADFLHNIFIKKSASLFYSIEEINETYAFQFQKGRFQTAIFKIDGGERSMQTELDYINEKIHDFVSFRLHSICHDAACISDSSSTFLLMNYNENDQKQIRTTLKKFLNELLCQKEILHHISVTLGIGRPCCFLEDIPLSLKTAQLVIEQRLISGTNILIDESYLPTEGSDSDIFPEFNRHFSEAIDKLSEREINECFTTLKKQLIQASSLSGHALIQSVREAVLFYVSSMQKNGLTIPDKETFLDNFQKSLNNQNSWQDVISLLYKNILESFKSACNARKQEAGKPIREAKNYIKANLKDNLTLEQVSSVAGFNSSYFSFLFKKETGTTFSEYVIQVRMEKAKELLKTTDWNISLICEEVGYNDLKNFTKNFKKYTGLRPNEFRKIYS